MENQNKTVIRNYSLSIPFTDFYKSCHLFQPFQTIFIFFFVTKKNKLSTCMCIKKQQKAY